MAIISSKNVCKFDKQSNIFRIIALAMISTEITMIMPIHVTFGSIV